MRVEPNTGVGQSTRTRALSSYERIQLRGNVRCRLVPIVLVGSCANTHFRKTRVSRIVNSNIDFLGVCASLLCRPVVPLIEPD